jgi:large subunit ribosomal protein L13
MAKPKQRKTWIPKGNRIERKWYLIDADGAILGRLATRVATILMGKHKPTYTPFRDMGDHVVVVNAAKVRMTGEKMEQRKYMRYSGYMGGEKYTPLKERFEKEPQEVVRGAIQHMLPKTTLGKQMLSKLKVYSDDKHKQTAQKPEKLDLDRIRGGRICLPSTSGEPAAENRP